MIFTRTYVKLGQNLTLKHGIQLKKYGIGSCQKKHFASAQPLLITKYMMSLEKMGVEEGRVNKHKMDWTPDAGLYIAFMVSEIPKKKTW